MTGERKRGDESSVEAWDDEGGAAEREEDAAEREGGAAEREEGAAEREEVAAGEAANRAKRWADEQTEHWHGAASSDSTRGRAHEERAPE